MELIDNSLEEEHSIQDLVHMVLKDKQRNRPRKDASPFELRSFLRASIQEFHLGENGKLSAEACNSMYVNAKKEGYTGTIESFMITCLLVMKQKAVALNKKKVKHRV